MVQRQPTTRLVGSRVIDTSLTASQLGVLTLIIEGSNTSHALAMSLKDGIRAIQRTLKELKDNGFIRYAKYRDTNNKIVGHYYYPTERGKEVLNKVLFLAEKRIPSNIKMEVS